MSRGAGGRLVAASLAAAALVCSGCEAPLRHHTRTHHAQGHSGQATAPQPAWAPEPAWDGARLLGSGLDEPAPALILLELTGPDAASRRPVVYAAMARQGAVRRTDDVWELPDGSAGRLDPVRIELVLGLCAEDRVTLWVPRGGRFWREEHAGRRVCPRAPSAAPIEPGQADAKGPPGGCPAVAPTRSPPRTEPGADPLDARY